MASSEAWDQLHDMADQYCKEARSFYRKGDIDPSAPEIVAYANLLASCDMVRMLASGFHAEVSRGR